MVWPCFDHALIVQLEVSFQKKCLFFLLTEASHTKLGKIKFFKTSEFSQPYSFKSPMIHERSYAILSFLEYLVYLWPDLHLNMTMQENKLSRRAAWSDFRAALHCALLRQWQWGQKGHRGMHPGKKKKVGCKERREFWKSFMIESHFRSF